MNVDAIVSYAKYRNISLRKVQEVFPYVGRPDISRLIQFKGVEWMTTACNMYNLIKRFLKEDMIVGYDYCGYNDRVIEDMRSLYVPGIGSINIYDLDKCPSLTGQMLLLRSSTWDKMWDVMMGRDAMDEYDVFNIIAEMLARERYYPYDVTTMQLKDYNIPHLGAGVSSSPDCNYEKTTMGTVLTPYLTKCCSDRDLNEFRVEFILEVCTEGDNCYFEYGYRESGENSFMIDRNRKSCYMYIHKFDWYVSVDILYETRTRFGETVSGEVVK